MTRSCPALTARKKRHALSGFSYPEFRFLLILTSLLFASLFSGAQPLNNDCTKAIEITIPDNGFGLGTFNSAQADLTKATTQTGETFAASINTTGLNKKSVWFKFSLPTTRKVKVSLVQNGSAIKADAAGFAVYKTNKCLPANDDISQKLSTIEKFGSTENPCVDEGDYLIQVSGNNEANGPIFISLEVSDKTDALYDKPKDAQKFGKLGTYKVNAVDFLVQCQSIDSKDEVCLPNSSFKDFTKSTWHTFRTPDSFDWISVLLSESTSYNYYGDKYTLGYRIYEGDASTAALNTLKLIGGCDSMKTNGYYVDRKDYKCDKLKPNTTYTVQLLYHKDFIRTMRLAVAYNGGTVTKAPQPISTMPASNKMGILNMSLNGTTNTATDYLSCNARHSLYTCPKTLPGKAAVYNGYKYNLSTFYTFTLNGSASLDLSVYSSTGGENIVRLYRQSLTADCKDLDSANIIATFNSSTTLTCVPKGDYVLQVMGTDSARPYNNYYYYGYLYTSASPLDLYMHLGSNHTVNIIAKSDVAINRFSLNAAGRVEKLNVNGAGVMQPLKPYNTYETKPDTLGCESTVLPKDNCGDTRASYREFVISDSLMIGFSSINYNYLRLYKGDADALATAQNKFSYPKTIDGLIPVNECVSYSSYPTTNKTCITPGTYTLVTTGPQRNWYNQSVIHQPSLVMLAPKTKHASPETAQNMGDLWSQLGSGGGTVYSDIDTFSCRENPAVIDGVEPCDWGGLKSTKLIYRQFYLSKPSLVQITVTSGYNGYLSLFSGKASDGIKNLKKYQDWSCFYYRYYASQCDILPPGWYTVVAYGHGPSYENPKQTVTSGSAYGNIGEANAFQIYLNPGCAQPKFNRPYKASVDTNTKKPYLIEWGNQTGHTEAYPVTHKKYTLNTENFDCTIDTAFISKYMKACSSENMKVAFYVFQITKESYIQVDGIPNGLWTTVYDFDVRTADSVKLKTATPLQTCLNHGGKVEFCKLQPGYYTLIFYAPYNYSCSNVTPTIYVDKIGYSRFDHAQNAYDFGAIKPDSLWHNGKAGDVNPLNAGRAPSNDFFYCTTGAREKDPELASCYSKFNPNIYNGGNNISLHPDNSTSPDWSTIDRRNLWYTFTVKQPGWVRVKVTNKTPGKNTPYYNQNLHQYPYAVFRSDVDGSLPFNQVVANGEVDSTLLQGLTFITRNHNGGSYYHCQGPEEISFYIPPCEFKETRYYILVENRNMYGYGEIHEMNPNSQVEVSLLLDSVNALVTKFDHFSQANDLGTVNTGRKKGAVDNFTCATRDLPDPLYAYTTCQKTLWYKFTTTVTGTIRYAAFFKEQYNYYYDHIQLFRQIKPDDSTSAGLLHLPMTTSYYNNGNWAQQCISPGTYYIILPGCNAVDEDVFPEIEIIPQAGDFCSAPMITSLNGKGNKSVGAVIDCHTIGTDYGEFNEKITCPPGAEKIKYKSTWYRLDVGGKDTLDVTVYINEQTNANSSEIKYRMMTGNCGAMQEQSCVQDALTRNTYKCLAPGTSYFIQVFTPLISVTGYAVTGSIDLNISAVTHTDTCLPGNTCIAVANFTTQFDCTKDKGVQFINSSTYGSSIKYEWDFGHDKQISTEYSPLHIFPASTTNKNYKVRLIVTNTSCNRKDTTELQVAIPARAVTDLGKDTLICNNGASIKLDATSFEGATYYWSNGSTSPTTTYSGSGNHWVEVKYKNCVSRDTMNVFIMPVPKRSLQTLALCKVDQVNLSAYRGYGENYRWSNGTFENNINVTQPGYYWVDIYLNGCTVRDSFLVVSTDLHPLGNDTTICQSNMPWTIDATVSGATSYKWNDNSTNSTFKVTKPGTYWLEVQLGGCTFSDTIKVSVDSFKTETVRATICEGQQYTLPSGKKWSTTGTIKDTLYSTSGCARLITTLNLTVQEKKETTLKVALCAGDKITLPSGLVVSTAGQVSDTVRYVSGCDSIITHLTTTVALLKRDSIVALICSGKTYTLPSGKNVSAAGIYSDTLRYAGGCDSLIRVVSLNVYFAGRTTVNASFCSGKSYTLPSGKNVALPGKYIDTLRSVINGCDSAIITTNLSLLPAEKKSITASICAGGSYLLPSGKSVTLSGEYIDTLRTSLGCDSIINTITLTVDTIKYNPYTVNMCEGQRYKTPSGKFYDAAGTYKDTLQNIRGCDSIVYTITLSFNAVLRKNISTLICSGSMYALPSGKPASATGLYSDTLKYKAGCDSVIYTVDLTVFAATKTTINASFCSGKSYTLPSGRNVISAGKYVDTLRSVLNGCDSAIITTNLSLIPAEKKSFNATICAGATYLLPSGRPVKLAAVYVDTLRTALGCDSVISTVTLTIDEKITESKTVSICAGTQYIAPSGQAFDKAGTFSDTLRNMRGCDSIITKITLSLAAVTRKTLSSGICDGSNYTLPSGIVVTKQNQYQDTLKYVGGCDSVIYTINLTVFGAVKESISAAICTGNSYLLPSGKSVSTAGRHLDTLRNHMGCDSILYTIQLRLIPVVRKDISASICFGDSYTFPSGRQTKLAGNYADTIHGAAGCDSIITNVVLVVETAERKSVSAAVCTGTLYKLPSGQAVTLPGIYKDTVKNIRGCDSLITTLTLSNKIATASAIEVTQCIGEVYTLPWGDTTTRSGVFRKTILNTVGCDSTVTVTITRRAPLKLTISGTPTVCEGGTVVLNATATGGMGAGYQYSWSVPGANNNQLSFVPAGKQQVIVTVSDGCTVLNAKDTVDVEAVKNPVAGFTVNSKSGCAPFTARFTNTSSSTANSFSWNFGNAAPQSSQQNPTVNFTQPGKYPVRLTVKTSAGCTGVFDDTITVVAKPVVRISAPASICIGSSVNFRGSATGNVEQWNWDFGNGNSSHDQQPAAQQYNVAGTYIIRLVGTAAGACPDTALFTLTVGPKPVVTLNTHEIKICRGGSTQLVAGGGVKYNWTPVRGLSDPSIANPVASPTTDILYHVTVTSAEGCTATDSVSVTVSQPFAIHVTENKTICFGEQVTLRASGAVSYTWTPATGLSSINTAETTAKPEVTTTYTVTGYGDDQCFTSEQQVTVTVVPLPEVNLGRDTSVYSGDSFVINSQTSSDVVSYTWAQSNSLSCNNCPSPLASPKTTVTYKLTVANAQGCKASDDLRVTLACSDKDVFIPNTFTPNGDGANDIFYPRGKGIRSVKYLRIFNRWGELVFENKDFNIDDKKAGWGGVYKGQRLPSGVFVYSIQLICDNGQRIDKSGSIMIVR